MAINIVTKENLTIVIVNFRTSSDVIRSLASLAPSMGKHSERNVVVVDNFSEDNSVELINSAVELNGWASWVEVIPWHENCGFSAGNNVAIRAVLSENILCSYFWLLNPDTMVNDDSCDALVEFLDSNPDVGIAGSRIFTSEDAIECSAFRAVTPLSQFVHAASIGYIDRFLPKFVVPIDPEDSPHECDWVSGASMMVRREVIDQIGLMDEGYFLYFEEVDFCNTARVAGWGIWHVPQSKIVHVGGVATGKENFGSVKPGFWFDSRRRYLLKWFGYRGLILADILWFTGYILLAVKKLLRIGNKTQKTDLFRCSVEPMFEDVRALIPRQISKKNQRQHYAR